MNKPSALSEPASVSTEPTAAHRGPSPVTANGRAFTPREFAFLIGVPLSWGVLLLFHPSGDGKEMYLELKDKVTPWMVVHIGQMFFIPLMAIVVDLLLRGVEGGAARVSRIALVPFVVFYTAFELLQGIGNGILVNAVNGLPQAERATGQPWSRISLRTSSFATLACSSASAAWDSSPRQSRRGSRCTATPVRPSPSRSCSALPGS